MRKAENIFLSGIEQGNTGTQGTVLCVAASKPNNTQNRPLCSFRGAIYTKEDLGNIHFGYVGAFLFSESELHIGAGMYQIYSGTKMEYWSSWFDSPRDYDMVAYGWQLCWEANGR